MLNVSGAKIISKRLLQKWRVFPQSSKKEFTLQIYQIGYLEFMLWTPICISEADRETDWFANNEQL